MTYKHIEDVSVTACFSDCRKYRYRLTVEKDGVPKGKTACVIMLNPSKANEKVADKTVQFVEKLVFTKKYKEFLGVTKIIIVNQFAYMQTKRFCGHDWQIGQDNDMHVQRTIDESEIILIAWGKNASGHKVRVKKINHFIDSAEDKILLQTRGHPSRGWYKNFIEAYDS